MFIFLSFQAFFLCCADCNPVVHKKRDLFKFDSINVDEIKSNDDDFSSAGNRIFDITPSLLTLRCCPGNLLFYCYWDISTKRNHDVNRPVVDRSHRLSGLWSESLIALRTAPATTAPTIPLSHASAVRARMQLHASPSIRQPSSS